MFPALVIGALVAFLSGAAGFAAGVGAALGVVTFAIIYVLEEAR